MPSGRKISRNPGKTHGRNCLNAFAKTAERQWRAKPAQQRLIDENETGFYGLSHFNQSFLNKASPRSIDEHCLHLPTFCTVEARLCILALKALPQVSHANHA